MIKIIKSLLIVLFLTSFSLQAHSETSWITKKDKTKKTLVKKTETKAKKIVAKAKKKKDFWLDGRGNLWSIDPQDLPSPLGGGAMAMTKPGGAVQGYVDQAISKYGGGGGGGNFNITVNVDGSKNPVDTGRQVVNELKKAQDKIMGGTR